MPTAAAKRAADKAYESLQERLGKNFKGRNLVDFEELDGYKVIPTGSIELDNALGVGGWVEGRLVELWGEDGVGKTTLSLLSIAEAQKLYPDMLYAWIDMEQTLDKTLVRNLGVKKLKVFTPESAEDVADVVKELVSSGLFKIVVLDSIGAMIPEAEKKKDAEDAVVANQAKIVTRMVKIAAVECNNTDTVLILINQVRANIVKYGPQTQSGGGFSLRHCTTHKVNMSKRATKDPYTVKIEGDDVKVGHQIRCLVERNKVAPPNRTATIDLFVVPTDKYGPRGIDKAAESIKFGLRTGRIIQSGAWYTIASTGERFNGREKLLLGLRAQPDVVADIRAAAIEMLADLVVYEDAPVAEDDEIEISPSTPEAPAFTKGTAHREDA